MKASFGQVVIGPPGSGKTTYCNGMQQFLSALKRPVCIINLDPANDNIPYDCDVDISELITLEDVMDNLQLGPNGGLLYCMEYLEANMDWLVEKLKEHTGKYESFFHNLVIAVNAFLIRVDNLTFMSISFVIYYLHKIDGSRVVHLNIVRLSWKDWS